VKSEASSANLASDESASVAVFNAVLDWTEPYHLLRQELPSDEIVAHQIVRRAKAYIVINGLLHIT
jgi:hypothetical protein